MDYSEFTRGFEMYNSETELSWQDILDRCDGEIDTSIISSESIDI
jgi:hypothetical protein